MAQLQGPLKSDRSAKAELETQINKGLCLHRTAIERMGDSAPTARWGAHFT